MNFSKWLQDGGCWYVMTTIVILVLIANIFAIGHWHGLIWPKWYVLIISLPTNVFVFMTTFFGSIVDDDHYNPVRFLGLLLWFVVTLIMGIYFCTNYAMLAIYSLIIIAGSWLLASRILGRIWEYFFWPY